MDEIQKIWSQWAIVDLIGKGAFGKVYKVKREELGNVSYAAVKVIHIPLDETEIRELQHSGMEVHSIQLYFQDMVKNLFNEIKILETLKSANNIVNIEDYEVIEHTKEIGWDVYIRMELLIDMRTYLETHEMSVSEVVNIGIDLCNALIDCEKVNIIHRDIKIDNVFVTKFGNFKLGDFGISKQLEKTQSALSQKGTNMYMAPEVVRGEHYNNTVDIYSLGIMMYRLLNNGRFPFMPPINSDIRYDDTQRAMEKRLSGEAMDMPACADKDLGKIILKACSFASEDRYQSAEEFKQDLECYASSKLKQSGRLINISMDQKKDEETDAVFGTKKQPGLEKQIPVSVEPSPVEPSPVDPPPVDPHPVNPPPVSPYPPPVFPSPKDYYSFKEFYEYNCPQVIKAGRNISIVFLYILCVIKAYVIFEALFFTDMGLKTIDVINIIFDPIIVLILTLYIHIKKSEFCSRFLLAYSIFMLLSARRYGLLELQNLASATARVSFYGACIMNWMFQFLASLLARTSLYEVYKRYDMFLAIYGYSGDSKLHRLQKSKWGYGLSEEKIYRDIPVIGVGIGLVIIVLFVAAGYEEKIYDFIYKYMSYLFPDI